MATMPWPVVTLVDYAGPPAVTLNIIHLSSLGLGACRGELPVSHFFSPPKLSLGKRSPGSMGLRHTPPTHAPPTIAPTAGPSGLGAANTHRTLSRLTHQRSWQAPGQAPSPGTTHDRLQLQATTCQGHGNPRFAMAHATYTPCQHLHSRLCMALHKLYRETHHPPLHILCRIPKD